MPADKNFSHRGGVFPQPLLDQYLGSISSMSGMVMAENTSTLSNHSSTNPPCNSFGDTLRDPTNSSNHCMGLSIHWSRAELEVLRHGLVRYANESSSRKYIKISNLLPDKAVRDVAMRCLWMTKKEQGKRLKSKKCYTSKKVKVEKEMLTSSSNAYCIQPENTATYSHSVADVHQSHQVLNEDPATDNDVQHLLVENLQIINQIERNLAANEIEGNAKLFCHAINNIAAILNNTSQMPGTASERPSLPAVSVDDCLLHCMFSGTNQRISRASYKDIRKSEKNMTRECRRVVWDHLEAGQMGMKEHEPSNKIP